MEIGGAEMPSKNTVILSARVKTETKEIFNRVATEGGITTANLLNLLAVMLDGDGIDLSPENAFKSTLKKAAKDIGVAS